MCSKFVAHGMLPESAGHAGFKQQLFFDSKDGDSGPVEEQDILEDVILAHSCGMSFYPIDKSISDFAKLASIRATLKAFQFT